MMAFRCPECGEDMDYKGFTTILGRMFGWACAGCDIFLSSREIKKILCMP